MHNPFADEDSKWEKRDSITSKEAAIALVADRVAVVISKYCRMQSYSGYDEDEENENSKYPTKYIRKNGTGCYVYECNDAPLYDDDDNKIWPNGKRMTNDDDENIDEEGNVIPEPVDPRGNKENLKESINEIGKFAAKFEIPFNPEITFAIGLNIDAKNDDAWRNSSIGC